MSQVNLLVIADEFVVTVASVFPLELVGVQSEKYGVIIIIIKAMPCRVRLSLVRLCQFLSTSTWPITFADTKFNNDIAIALVVYIAVVISFVEIINIIILAKWPEILGL